MKIIGITGGIGCGKSRVCAYMREKYGAEIIMADDIGHEVMLPGTKCHEKLQSMFEPECFNEDGTLNRKKVGNIAFKDPAVLERMNSVIHPAVWEEIMKRLENARQNNKNIAVLEAAILLESKYADICDELWYIYADRGSRVERLLSSREITGEKIGHVMERQLSEKGFREGCDFVIDNSGDFEKTAVEIDLRLAERHFI